MTNVVVVMAGVAVPSMVVIDPNSIMPDDGFEKFGDIVEEIPIDWLTAASTRIHERMKANADQLMMRRMIW